jgi:death on curing protein
VTEIIWITESDTPPDSSTLLALNGCAAGICDFGLLQSALARPQQLHKYLRQPDILDLAASYILGLVKNHTFVHGNKRFGFSAGILFQEINGHTFTANQNTAADTILAVASGTLDEVRLAMFLRETAYNLQNSSESSILNIYRAL